MTLFVRAPGFHPCAMPIFISVPLKNSTLYLIRKLLIINTGEKFLNRTPMVYALRSRIDKWDLMKLQSFCKAKDTDKKTKWQPTDWERIFTNSTSDRGLVSNIYKEFKKLDSRESNNLIKNFSTEEY